MLTRRVGVRHSELVEDAVQSALMAALTAWTERGLPGDPSAWLYKVAYNQLIQDLRRESGRLKILEKVARDFSDGPLSPADAFSADEIRDDILRMLFVCCDEAVPAESQLVLALKTLCGFSTAEIASRLFTSEANVHKRLGRARDRLRQAPLDVETPPLDALRSRLPNVHGVLYLLFNEGYLSARPEQAIRRELCDEALRLATLLAEHLVGAVPETFALLALMHFHIARLGSRIDGMGGLLLLEEQDRSLWDREHNTQQRLALDLRLRHALQRGEFFLVYQPIVDADGSDIVAVEALLRWADPERGVVSPADFIPVLEQTGLIVEAGRWVLHEACRQGRAWLADGARELVLSVNVSPRQFAEPEFVDTVTAVLAATGFPAAQLQLEVTEGLLLEPSPQSLQKIDALVARGVRLAVDDFGMGYSSLAYLKRFPLHTLKIDRLFVRDLPLARRDAAIVRAIVDLGHGLGLQVTAEGVETADQFHELRRLGCDSMQGYLFARPASAAAMALMLARPGRVGEAADSAAPGWSTTMAALLESAETA